MILWTFVFVVPIDNANVGAWRMIILSSRILDSHLSFVLHKEMSRWGFEHASPKIKSKS